MKSLKRLDRSVSGGLTVIEILVVIGILAILFAIGLPISINFYFDYILISERDTLVSTLTYARNLALINANESDHGLFLAPNNLVIFQGSSYASRNVSEDKNFPRASAVAISGPNEIVFKSLSSQTASSTYGLSNARRTFNVYVNSEGRIEY